MDETGGSQRTSIINYFKREKSAEVSKIGSSTKCERDVSTIGLNEETVGLVETCPTSSENTNNVVNNRIQTDTKELSSCVNDLDSTVVETNVESDIFQGNKCALEDLGNSNCCKNSIQNDSVYKSTDCKKKEKSKWSFTWKGKTKKAKTSDAYLECETKNDSSDIASKSCQTQDGIFIKKTQVESMSKNERKRSNPSTNLCDTKSLDKSLSTKDTDTSKLQLSLGSKSSNCVLESESELVKIQNVSECNDHEKAGRNLEEESDKMNMETCGNMETKSVQEIAKTVKVALESGKRSYLDVLMRSSKEKAREKLNTSGVCGEVNEGKTSHPFEGNIKEDLTIVGGRRRKVCKTSRNKQAKISAADDLKKDDAESNLLRPNRKQNKSHIKDAKVDKNEKKEKIVKKSIRRKSFKLKDYVSDSDRNEAVNIGCSSDDVITKPRTRSRNAKTLKSVKTTPRTKRRSEETKKETCFDRPLESEVNTPILELNKEQEGVSEHLSAFQEGNETKIERRMQLGENVDEKEDRGDTSFSKRQTARRKRLRRSCILDSDGENEVSSESQKEEKPSTAEVTKTKNEDKSRKVNAGPIAPIFLPGAWRRAKAKLEEVEQLEAKLNVVEIEDDSPSFHSFKSSNPPAQSESHNPLGDSSCHSGITSESTVSMAAFLGMFQRPSIKPCAVVIEFVEAPFPKVSHVRQQDDEMNNKWNLPMVRNRYIKEEYFFSLDIKEPIIQHNLFSWFLRMDNSSTEKKMNSKCFQLKIITEMDKSQKQKIVLYLKTIYQGVPVKKLFKRYQNHLEICKKAEMEANNVSRLSTKKGSFKASYVKAPSVSTTGTNFSRSPATSAQVRGKTVSYTKISKKKSITKVKKKKSLKKQESPLLLALKNQENAASSKKEEIKVKSTKGRTKRTSIMDFMSIQGKKSENVPKNKQRAKSRNRKNTDGRIVNKIEAHFKKNASVDDKNLAESKKRARESEDDGSKDCTSEENVRPTVKKVKLVTVSQEFKKPRKGQKRKLRRVESKENTDVVEIKDDKTDAEERTSKCRKISSDDDFLKARSSRSQESKKSKENRKHAVQDSAIETRRLRKSKRLQDKVSADETDKQSEPIIVDGNKESDLVELHTGKDVSHTGKVISQQEDQIQNKEGDIQDRESNILSSEPLILAVEEASVPEADQESKQQSSCNEKDANVETGGGLSSVLWSECFKPRNSSEILGNNNAGAKLRNWLSEWKTLRERKLEALKRHEEKKRQKLAMKKVGQTSSSWWHDDDDSDFCSSESSSDDNFCDEDSVCNTMLLSGPVGCGKTSAVYACAEELGFKVIEVNTSTKRGGKYILSELMEATQSHQVSTKRNLTSGQSSLMPHAYSNTRDSTEKKQKEKVAVKKDTELSKKGRPKKKKEHHSTESQLQGQMSLILLDEVDLLFEEDKGFWVSVNTLRQNSKRPIVMTASDPAAVDIDGEFERITLKSPSFKLFAAYLQTVCLTKNVFVNPSDIQILTCLHHGDIRRSLLNMQFWIDSKAGACDQCGVVARSEFGTDCSTASGKEIATVVNYDNRPKNTEDATSVELGKDISNPGIIEDKYVSEMNSGNVIVVGNVTNSSGYNDVEEKSTIATSQASHEGECASTKIVKEFKDTSSSCGSNSVPKQELLSYNLEKANVDSTVKVPEFSSVLDGQVSNEKPSDEATVLDKDEKMFLEKKDIEMHKLLLESHLGLRNVNNDVTNVLEILKCDLNNVNSFHQKCLVTSHCQHLNIDVVYCNLETLLPCVFCSGSTVDSHPQSHEGRPASDTEMSHDAGQESNHDNQSKSLQCQHGDSTENESSCVSLKSSVGDKPRVCDEDIISNKLDGISLESLSHIYEDMSFMDSELHCESMSPTILKERYEPCSVKISPGLEDSVCKGICPPITWKAMTTKIELRGALEVASLEHSHKRFHDLCNCSDKQVVEYASKLKTKSCLLSPPIKNSTGAGVDRTNCIEDGSVDANADTPKKLDTGPCLQVTTLTEIPLSKKRKLEHNYTSTSSNLSELHYLNRRSMFMDYLSTLKTICQSESLRKAARVKRRYSTSSATSQASVFTSVRWLRRRPWLSLVT